MVGKKSPVWAHFVVADNGAKCLLCNKEVLGRGNTTNLFQHIKINHYQAYIKLKSGVTQTVEMYVIILGFTLCLFYIKFWDVYISTVSATIGKPSAPYVL